MNKLRLVVVAAVVLVVAVGATVPFTQQAAAADVVIGARVSRNTSQSIPNTTLTAINFTTEAWDTDNIWSAANPSRLTCRTTGYYLITGAWGWEADANSNYRYILIYKNGNSTAGRLKETRPPASSFDASVPIHYDIGCIAYLEADDYIEMGGMQDAGHALNALSDGTNAPYLSMVLLNTNHGAKVYNTADQTIPTATHTAVNFNAEVYDTDSLHDTVTNNNRITINTTGYYAIMGEIIWTASASGSTRLLGITNNGAPGVGDTLGFTRMGSLTGTWNHVYTCNALAYLESGDYVSLYVYQDTGGNLDIKSEYGSLVTAPSFEVFLIQTGGEGAHAYNDANQNIPTATWTAVALNSELHDTDTIHDNVTNNSRLTCNTAGYYFIQATGRWNGSSSGDYRTNTVCRNASENITVVHPSVGSWPAYDQIWSIVTIEHLAVNDYIELRVYQDTGSSLAFEISSGETYTPKLAMHRIDEYSGGCGPAVETNATDDIENTTATLNGNVTAINDSTIDDRGFVWGTTSNTTTPGCGEAPADTNYDNYWTESGTFGVGVFDHGITGLATATTHYGRAAANNSDGDWGWGAEVSWLTKPAAPTNVAATDGVHTDKVVVTWTKSSGTVTGYKIYRDGGLIDSVGDVATYDDTGADAGTVTPGTAAATDGTYPDKVTVSVSGDSANVGTTHTYKVRAYNAAGDSDDSGTDTGYRGVGSLTYQWYRSFGCAATNYSALGGATTDPYDDMTAPAPTINSNSATACDGCSSAFVTLACNESASNGVCRYYLAQLGATGAVSQNCTSDSGYRGTTSFTYQWWRSWADSAANYTQIAGATTDPYNDSGGATAPDARYYLVTVAMTGATSVNSSADRGYMTSGNITALYVYPQWHSRFVGLNATLWAVAWAGSELAVNETVTWNTSGVGSILWCENVTGSDGRADCKITSNTTGNQTVGCSGAGVYDEGVCLWVDDSPTDLPTWYFAILGVAIIGAWYTKEMILYIMATVACSGMLWWVQNSTLESETIITLTAIFVIIAAVMVFGMLRHGQFSFVRGGDSE